MTPLGSEKRVRRSKGSKMHLRHQNESEKTETTNIEARRSQKRSIGFDSSIWSNWVTCVSYNSSLIATPLLVRAAYCAPLKTAHLLCFHLANPLPSETHTLLLFGVCVLTPHPYLYTRGFLADRVCA
jgi:hypothetical protein